MNKRIECKANGIERYVAGVLILIFLGSLNAQAADIYWDNGGIGQDWNTTSNWVGDVAPVGGDKVYINLDGADKAVYSSGTSENYSAVRPNVGDITHPHLVGARYLQIFDQVPEHRQTVCAIRCPWCLWKWL